jgi:hypothetical protein
MVDKKIMFIMFPGSGVSKKGWDTHYEKGTGKKIKTNFISKLKKMGSVYFYEPLYNNLKYYIKNEPEKSLYDKNIDFTKEDLDVEKECEKIYEKIKDFDGMFIPIGHSIGSFFVYCFQKKYPSRCLFSVIIDGTCLGPIEQEFNDKKELYPKIKKYQKYNDIMINKLKEKLYKNNDIKTFNKLADIYIYNIFKYKEITNKAEKFNKPVIQFSNLRITDNKKKLKINHFVSLSKVNEIEHFKKYNNDDNYIPIIFINKSHFLHDIDDSREIILNSIKEMIDKYSK